MKIYFVFFFTSFLDIHGKTFTNNFVSVQSEALKLFKSVQLFSSVILDSSGIGTADRFLIFSSLTSI